MRSIYRKKPLEVQAIQYTIANWEAVAQFLAPELATKRASMVKYGVGEQVDYHLSIKSLENEVDYGLAATIGDWIIRGTAGEVYPCKNFIFAQVYEHVRDEA